MRKQRWHGALVLIASMAGAVYFAHHAVSGTHGFESGSRLTAKSVQISREVAALVAVRDRLRVEVSLLATEPPDKDMVEELARDTLGLLYPNEQVVR
ncbi:MAG: hypothetical protein RLZ98_3831 [Pseudomonadota bacterium]|jgi:cell division protein FtsB